MANLPPRVSVVIPTYNRAPLLKEAVDSVLRQTTPVHEIIVVDDGSTDSTDDLVRSYGLPVLFLTQDHAGMAAARNRALARATGEWIAFLDSDDLWRPTKLERQLQYLDQHPQCGLVHTGRYHFGVRETMIPPSPHFLEGDYKIEYLLCAEDWICISSVLVRNSLQVSFREWAVNSADVIFFAEFLRSGIQFGYVNAPLVGYRVHAGAANFEAGSQVRGLSSQWRWVCETFASDPQERRRLQHNLLTKVLQAMNQAKWCRDWRAYWEWRHWLTEHWPSDLPRPEVLCERIYSPVVYKLKDSLYKLAASAH